MFVYIVYRREVSLNLEIFINFARSVKASLKCSFVQDFSEEYYLPQTPTPLLHLEALVPPSPIMKASPPEEVEECQMMITLRPSTIYPT